MLQKMIDMIRAKLGNTAEADALVAELQAEEAGAAPAADAPVAAPAAEYPMIEGEGDYFPPPARYTTLRAEYDAQYKEARGLA